MTDIQNRLANALAERYRIDKEIGAGGMATVYLAEDLKHKRQVAVKVLNPELGAVLGTERFLAEIQTTANLQHPHLLPLFDSGEADGQLFYVMPFIEGESLRARLDHERQLSVDETIRIAKAIASALDYAHRHGVIHRDLKPENILLHDGEPVVADFGIALAVRNAGGNRITQTGLSLGTPQYMSPEQATGDRTIDGRTDIYSLGAIVYEMLTGEPPHMGGTSQAIIARLMTEKPREIRLTRSNVPEHVQAAVERALEKLPADRFEHAREFAEALAGTRVVQSTSRAASATNDGNGSALRRTRVAAAALLVLLAALTGFAAWRGAFTTPARPVPAYFSLELPDSMVLWTGAGSKVAITRDGKRIAFIAASLQGERNVYVRDLDSPTIRKIDGTQSVINVSFSPDGQFLVLNVSNTLRVIPFDGGGSKQLVEDASAPSWGDNGQIAFVRQRSIWSISSDGGEARKVLVPDSTKGIRAVSLPRILPGGSHALVTYLTGANLPDSTKIGVVSLESGELSYVGVGHSARYVASGHIVFGKQAGELFAAPFSLRKLKITGPEQLIAQQVWGGLTSGAGFDISDNGTLVYQQQSGVGVASFVKVHRSGRSEPIPGTPAAYQNPRVSPDGQRIVYRIGEPANIGVLWVLDITSGAVTRLTSDGSNRRAIWMPDGKRILYQHRTATSMQLIARYWDRSGPDSIMIDARGWDGAGGVLNAEPGWRGGYIAYRVGSDVYDPDIYIGPINDWTKRTPLAMASGDAVEASPAMSPDGRLLAYISNETGRYEVYVTPVPGPGPRLTVSIAGGTEPMWAPTGSTLYYRTSRAMMAARITTQPELAVVSRDSLFADSYLRYTWFQNYDVFPDGQHFLMIGPTVEQKGEVNAPRINVITNWQEMMKRGTGG